MSVRARPRGHSELDMGTTEHDFESEEGEFIHVDGYSGEFSPGLQGLYLVLYGVGFIPYAVVVVIALYHGVFPGVGVGVSNMLHVWH